MSIEESYSSENFKVSCHDGPKAAGIKEESLELLRRVDVVVTGAVVTIGTVDAVGAYGAVVACDDGINVVVMWISISEDGWKWMFVAMSKWMLHAAENRCVCVFVLVHV